MRWPWSPLPARPEPARLTPHPDRSRVFAAAPVAAPLGASPTGTPGAGRTTVLDARRWQATAWAHRHAVGPIRGGLSWQADTIGGIRFGLAVHIADDEKPVPADTREARRLVPPQLLADAQAQLDRLPLHDSRFKAALAGNLLTAGEVHLHGRPVGRGEQWDTLSMFQIRPRPGDDTQILDMDTQQWRYPAPGEEVVRLHVPDPAFPWMPDAPLRDLEEECQQIVLAMLELRALGLSRIAANGWLLLPSTLRLLRHTVDETANPDVSVTEDEFLAEFAAAGLAPISNPGSPGAALPALLMGEREDLKEVRHVKADRAAAPEVLERYHAFLRIVFETLDLPVEQLDGIGSMKYWNGLVVTADRYRSYVEPRARLLGDALGSTFIRQPMVGELRHDPAQVALLRVVPYGEHLMTNPNRLADAKIAYDGFAISPRALREAAAFGESDAPTDDELRLMLAIKTGADAAEAAALLQPLLRGTPPVVPPAAPQPDPDPTPDPPAAPPRSAATTPQTFAVAEPGEASRLADMDRDLRGRLVVAADAALTRAVEQAAARLRSQARSDAALRSRLAGQPIQQVGQLIGRDGCRHLGVDVRGLLLDAFTRLGESFEAWALAAVADAGRVLARLLGMDRATVIDRLTLTIRPRLVFAFEPLRDELERLADLALFDPASPPGAGEPYAGRVPPGVVRAALATAGGWADPSLGGIAASQPATDMFIAAGWSTRGYLWRYGYTLRNVFPPHLDRDGVQFDGPRVEGLRADPEYASVVGQYYHPGDHPGCGCDWVTLWAPPSG